MNLSTYLRLTTISQNEFAKHSGVAQSTISKIVRIEEGVDPSGSGINSVTALRIVNATGGAITIKDMMEVSQKNGENV